MGLGYKVRDAHGVECEVDRMSTILGNPCRIIHPVGTPKPREECQPFTYTLATLPGAPEGATYTGEGGRYVFAPSADDPPGPRRYGYHDVPDVKGQEKFAKSLTTLLAKQAREAAKRAKAEAKRAKLAA